MLAKDQQAIRKLFFDSGFREKLILKRATDRVHESIVCRAKAHREAKEKSRLARSLTDEYRKRR